MENVILQPAAYGRRVKAFLIDYVLLLLYASLLFLVTWALNGGELQPMTPLKGQLIGFFTLTLPLFLYFTLLEGGARNATIGKRVMSISVRNKEGGRPALQQVVIRNLVKFLPWEIAHTFVHQLFHYLRTGQEVPLGIGVGLVVPQAVVLLYIITPLWQSQKQSIYDRVAKTIVYRVQQ